MNCVIYRLETGENFWKGRSYCPHCRHKLGLGDLIPVFSFLRLRGRCRYCQQKISWQYPLVELSTGIIFFLIAFTGVNNYAMAYLLTPFLVVIFVYDLKHYIIPDKVIYPAIAMALISNIRCVRTVGIFEYSNIETFVNPILAAILASGFFAVIVLASKGKWMGLGDVKLAFLMGLILGFPNVLAALFLAFFTGAIIGIGLIALGRKKMKSEVPFGPFLVTGTLIAMFWGEELINWYLRFYA